MDGLPTAAGIRAGANGELVEFDERAAPPAPDGARPIFRRLTGRGAELLRFATAGSVDDGKSTLIGRLLHDSEQVLSTSSGRAGGWAMSTSISRC
jgi:hypothetical protein